MSSSVKSHRNLTRLRPLPIIRQLISSRTFHLFAEQVVPLKPRPKTHRFDQLQLLQVLPQPQLPMHALLPLGALALCLDQPPLLNAFTMVPLAPPTSPPLTHFSNPRTTRGLSSTVSSSRQMLRQVHAPLQVRCPHRAFRGSHKLTLGQLLLHVPPPDLQVKVLLDLRLPNLFAVKEVATTWTSIWGT